MNLFAILSTMTLSLMMALPVAAQNFPMIPQNRNAGMSPILEKLSEMHQVYIVNGNMRDGTACHVNVRALNHEFSVELFDNRPDNALVTVTLKLNQRAVYSEFRDNPDKRTYLSIRDRIVYPQGGGARDVDLSINIEESNDGRKAMIRIEDRVKRRNYFCSGEKTILN